MAIPRTSKNYSGRKVDLALYPSINIPEVPVPSSAGPSPKAIAGPSKVAQNFVRIFLTPIGHYRGHPELGTEFMERLHSGAVRFSVDLLHVFSGEALRVVDFMRETTIDGTPLDERIESVELKDHSIDRGHIRLRIELTTQAGIGTNFLLPIIWSH